MSRAALAILSFCSLLSMGCAQVGSATSAGTSSGISSFSPTGGGYTSLPSEIDVTFSTEMNIDSVGTVSNWSLDCDDGSYSVSSVSYYSTTSFVVELPNLSLRTVDSCTLTASASMIDIDGNSMGASSSATYYYSSSSSSSGSSTSTYTSGAAPTGSLQGIEDEARIFGTASLTATASDSDGTVTSVAYYLDGSSIGSASSSPYKVSFNSANYSNGSHTLSMQVTDSSGNVVETDSMTIYTYNTSGGTGYAGGYGGSSFTATAPTGYNLVGLNLRAGSRVDNLQAIWKSGWGTSQSVSYSSSYGGTGGSAVSLSCPSGYRVAGLTGRSGSGVDALGLVCRSQSEWSSSQYVSNVGGSGGSSFELSCPTNTFATAINGYAGSRLDGLRLTCK